MLQKEILLPASSYVYKHDMVCLLNVLYKRYQTCMYTTCIKILLNSRLIVKVKVNRGDFLYSSDTRVWVYLSCEWMLTLFNTNKGYWTVFQVI